MVGGGVKKVLMKSAASRSVVAMESETSFLSSWNEAHSTFEERRFFQWEAIVAGATSLTGKQKEKMNWVAEILEERVAEETQSEQAFVLNNSATLEDFLPKRIDAQELNARTSCDFNPLRFFSIGETTHSRILAYLLDPRAQHGQGYIFLQIFLEQIGIKDREGPWIVTAEIGRVDVLIKRYRHPHSAILIENKCHYAIDQPNQLYRYWYQEIYLPNVDINPRGDMPYSPDRYRIVYLPADGNKSPERQALNRCADLPSVLPEAVPSSLVNFLTFYKDIRRWLTACIEKLPVDNHRLRQFLEQYNELWTY